MRMILELLKAELKMFYRNPGILFWAFGFPLIMAGILGLAFTKKQEQKYIISVVEEKLSENNYTAVSALKPPSGGYAVYEFRRQGWDASVLSMKRGESNLVLKILSSGEYEFFFDPNNQTSHICYLLLQRSIQSRENRETVFEAADSGGVIKQMDIRGSRYIDFLIPGLLALGVMNSCLWGTAWTLIELRMKKLLRRMMATPLPKSYFLFSHLLMRMILSGLEFIFLMIFGYFVFSVEVQGSLTALFLLFLAGNLAFTGIAVLISSRVANSQIGNGLINLVSFPMTICSGVFFSYHGFPDLFRNIVKYFPLTVLADGVRAVFTEGAGLQESGIPILILGITGLIFFGAGIRLYKWD